MRPAKADRRAEGKEVADYVLITSLTTEMQNEVGLKGKTPQFR